MGIDSECDLLTYNLHILPYYARELRTLNSDIELAFALQIDSISALIMLIYADHIRGYRLSI
jgi:hypothetical protein